MPVPGVGEATETAEANPAEARESDAAFLVMLTGVLVQLQATSVKLQKRLSKKERRERKK